MESIELRQGKYLPMEMYVMRLFDYFKKISSDHYLGKFSPSHHTYKSVYKKRKMWVDKEVANCEIEFNGKYDFNLIIKADMPKKDLESLIASIHDSHKEKLKNLEIQDSF